MTEQPVLSFNRMAFPTVLVGGVLALVLCIPTSLGDAAGSVLVRMHSPCSTSPRGGGAAAESTPPAGGGGATAEGAVAAPQAEAASEETRNALKACLLGTGVIKEEDTVKVDAMVSELVQPRHLATRPPQPLAFTHIPRNGGGVVETNLDHVWSEFGCGKVMPTGPDLQEVLHGAEPCVALFPGDKRWGIFEPGKAVPNMPPVEKIVGFSGLFSHGVCEFLGANCTYTTVLREPVFRFISHFNVECQAHHDAFGTLCDSLPEFVHSMKAGATWFYGADNMQTRVLSGDLTLDAKGQPCFDQSTCVVTPAFQVSQEHLLKAIHNLVFKYPVWGIMEDMPVYEKRLNRVYGYNIPESDTTFTNHWETDTVTREEISLVTAHDLTLYKFAKCVLDAGSPRFAA